MDASIEPGGRAAQTAAATSVRAVTDALWMPIGHRLPPDVIAGIEEEAAAADERGLLSVPSLDRLRGAGFCGLAVPPELEGGGAGLLECAAVLRRIAMADPALAIAVNMHLFSVGTAVEHWLRHRDSCGLLLEAIATQNRIVASAFAEPGLGGTILRSNSKATRVNGGYVVTGVKSPCSLAGECDLVCFQMEADPPERDGLMMALIPASSEGVRVKRTWDALGMRGSGSDTLLLEKCFVPDELVFHRSEPGFDDDEVLAAGLVWFCVTTTAIYLAVVSAALEAACEQLRRSNISYLGAARADLATVQARLGELVAGALPLEAACAGLASRLDSRDADPRSLLPVALAIKAAAVDACTRAVEGSAELLGARSYARTGTLARLWRDVQALRFHPPTRLASNQILGRWALELPFSFELDERPITTDAVGNPPA